jgi:hypothetical protein
MLTTTIFYPHNPCLSNEISVLSEICLKAYVLSIKYQSIFTFIRSPKKLKPNLTFNFALHLCYIYGASFHAQPEQR